MDWSGRISKCGDRDLRRLLYSAATTLIPQVRKPSPLRTWALRLQERKGFKKAAVAASRKLAIVLMCIWRVGTVRVSQLDRLVGPRQADFIRCPAVEMLASMRGRASGQIHRINRPGK